MFESELTNIGIPETKFDTKPNGKHNISLDDIQEAKYDEEDPNIQSIAKTIPQGAYSSSGSKKQIAYNIEDTNDLVNYVKDLMKPDEEEQHAEEIVK